MFTKSDPETRVDLLFRLLSFEVGPHIKPLFPPKAKPEPTPKLDVALHAQGASALCPPGMQPAPPAINAPGAPQPTDAVQCVPERRVNWRLPTERVVYDHAVEDTSGCRCPLHRPGPGSVASCSP
jgi:hypothetical protein